MIEVIPSHMKRWAHIFFTAKSVYVALSFVLAICLLFIFTHSVSAQTSGKRLLTVYDRNTESSFLTDKKTVGEALNDKGIELDPRDTVEPSRDEELIAGEYSINIYRARPVVVIDGSTRVKLMTPYQVPERIASDAKISMYPEDIARLKPSNDFVGDGAGLQMTIDRAVPLNLDLYTKRTQIRTQGATVGEMLKEKGVKLDKTVRVSVDTSTPITADMEVRVWKEGIQTISIDQPEPFPIEKVFDADRYIGYSAISAAGLPGVRTVTYEIEVKDGAEVSRKELANILNQQPVKQVMVVGIKSLPNALTQSKGAQMWTDSRGVVHRETYYDLNMSVVMQACGQGGYYEVRFDGMKVDRDGYIIVAANYGRYPRCSVVETSAGPAKVYDTGGFAVKHPEGFDLATDWSKADGR